MDQSAAPWVNLGAFAVLAWLITYLFKTTIPGMLGVFKTMIEAERQATIDARTQYLAALKVMRDEHATELQRLRTEHQSDRTAWLNELSNVRNSLRDVCRQGRNT